MNKQFRADLAKTFWGDDKLGGTPQEMAARAVSCADALIAELERTEAPQPEPPAPDLPRLGTGWKWADTKHVVTPFDFTYSKLSQRQFCGVSGGLIGRQWQSFQPLATPDWHNPENIESPGERWRFLVKGEAPIDGRDQFRYWSFWSTDYDATTEPRPNWTYRTPATRPLPPVLADEKEAQP